MRTLAMITAAGAFFLLAACNDRNREDQNDNDDVRQETTTPTPAPAPPVEDKGTTIGVGEEGVSVESKDLDVKAGRDTASIRIDRDDNP